MKAVRSSPLLTGRLYPHQFSWYSFLEDKSTPGHMVPSVASEKIPSDATGYFFFVLCTLLCTSLYWLSWLCLLSLMYNTHNTNTHAPGWIRTRNPSKRSAVGKRLRPPGHWDRHGIDPETLRLVAQCLNHYVTPGPVKCRLRVLNEGTSEENISAIE
jgi:hypothetical protein